MKIDFPGLAAACKKGIPAVNAREKAEGIGYASRKRGSLPRSSLGIK